MAANAEVEALKQQLAAAEAERDSWKAKAEGMLKCPATEWPTEGRTYKSGKPIAYPQYDLEKPKESFLAIRDFLIEDLCMDLPEGYEMPKREVEWVHKMLTYNLRGGKMNRGMMVVESSVEMFKKKGMEIDNETLCRFAVLGWCVEWLQAWLLVFDDMMDDSKTRRDQPCWYLCEGVGKIAINDGAMIEMMTYKILKRHFSTSSYYPQLLDLFLETTFQTEVGQLIDTLCIHVDLPDFTKSRWELIVKYKTAFYSFYIAVACGMIMSGVTDVSAYNKAREILVIMGVYFQAQDDFLDCFGTPEQIGKIGTDIQDKKCSWIFVNVFNDLASEEQKAFLLEHYGKCKVQTPEEDKIKQLFRDLKIPELYAKYEQDSYDKIQSLKGDETHVPWTVYEIFLKKIYKRTK